MFFFFVIVGFSKVKKIGFKYHLANNAEEEKGYSCFDTLRSFLLSLLPFFGKKTRNKETQTKYYHTSNINLASRSNEGGGRRRAGKERKKRDNNNKKNL